MATKASKGGFSAEKVLPAFEGSVSPFDLIVTREEALDTLAHGKVRNYRCKTIKAGAALECEVFPVWENRKTVSEAKAKITKDKQRRVNNQNAAKRIVRLINANFTQDDLMLTVTYRDAPPDMERARTDIRRYIRRLKAYYAKHFPGQEFKYLYVIEYMDGDGRRKRVHHHLICSAMNRDAAERLWTHGRANSARLQPDEYGLEAIGRYISKAPDKSKRWACSRNLKEPKITTADTKVSKAQTFKLYRGVETDAAAMFEKLYPGYRLLDVQMQLGEGLPGCYIYARMVKASGEAVVF